MGLYGMPQLVQVFIPTTSLQYHYPNTTPYSNVPNGFHACQGGGSPIVEIVVKYPISQTELFIIVLVKSHHTPHVQTMKDSIPSGPVRNHCCP